MPWRWMQAVLLSCLSLGCATPRLVYLNTGQGMALVYAPPKSQPIPVEENEFQRVMAQLVLDMDFSLVSEEDGPHVQLTLWDENLRAQDNFMDAKARRKLALSFAWDGAWAGVESAVKEVVHPLALKAMVTSAMAAYMVLVVAPEPLTKLVAIALTTYVIAYLGLETFTDLVMGWRRLSVESERAMSFDELEAAGHRFGRVLGTNGARVIILVLTAAMGGGTANIAAKGPLLPGFARAALAAETNAGFQMSAALTGGVRSISVAESAMSVGLAPSAVAMAARNAGESGGGGSTEPRENHPAPEGHTTPSRPPDPNAKPGGSRTKPSLDDDAATQRSLMRENDSADLLARNGYDVSQNPHVPGSRNPDFSVEGRIFDNYAPSTSNPRNIWSEVNSSKVNPIGKPRQADRIVLNLRDSHVDMSALAKQFTDWPMPNLKEVLVITRDGKVVSFWP